MFGSGFGLLSYIFNSEADDMEKEMEKTLKQAEDARKVAENNYNKNRDFAENEINKLEYIKSRAWDNVIWVFQEKMKEIKNVKISGYEKMPLICKDISQWNNVGGFQKTEMTSKEYVSVKVFSEMFQLNSAPAFFSMLKAEENLEKAREYAAKSNYETEQIKTRSTLLYHLGNLSKTYSSFIDIYMERCKEATIRLAEILHAGKIEQRKKIINKAKDYFNVEWQVDFDKLSDNDQRTIQVIYIMNNILYEIIKQPLLAPDGQIVQEAEKKIEQADSAMKSLPYM